MAEVWWADGGWAELEQVIIGTEEKKKRQKVSDLQLSRRNNLATSGGTAAVLVLRVAELIADRCGEVSSYGLTLTSNHARRDGVGENKGG